MTLMLMLDKQQFKIFYAQAWSFLNYPDDDVLFEKLGDVDPLDLKLFHMGPTTLENFTGIPAPYKEIAHEAFSVWESCQEFDYISTSILNKLVSKMK